MAGNWVENIAKGRVAELVERVNSNEPAGAVIVLVPLSTTTTAGEAQDYDNLTAFLGGTANEQTEGWSRLVLTDAEMAGFAVDDAENKMKAALPEREWNEPTAGKNTQGLAVCYDPKAGEGTDEEIVVLTVHDFAVTADGNDVILQAGNFFEAS